MTQIKFAIEDEADLADATQSATEASAEFQMETAVKEGEIGSESAIVTGVMVVGGVTLLAGVVMEWIERRKGGTLVDKSTDPLTLKRTKDVPYGFFIVVTSDGKITIDAKDTPKGMMQQVLEKILDGAFKSIGDIKDAVKEVAGDAVKVVE